jgi:rubredoxin
MDKTMSSETETTTALTRHECKACGYVYEPKEGDSRRGIPVGTAFADIPADWLCPVCSAPKDKFIDIGAVGAPSGFQENLGYGLGVNSLPPGPKNLLIFGALGLLFLFLLSFYSLG